MRLLRRTFIIWFGCFCCSCSLYESQGRYQFEQDFEQGQLEKQNLLFENQVVWECSELEDCAHDQEACAHLVTEAQPRRECL